MKAILKPLEGKYYGTEIEVHFDDGFEMELITLWNIGDFEISERQREINDDVSDSHFESKLTYERALKLVSLINNNKTINEEKGSSS